MVHNGSQLVQKVSKIVLPSLQMIVANIEPTNFEAVACMC